jgi:LmbE family N-acetylglucosaminyl deacetylase
MEPIVIVSPHLDDAVLSCWHLLDGPGDVRVVNVFTGAPPQGQPPGWWDRDSGATDSAVRVSERLEEDRAALALAGREGIGLDFCDEQYRDGAVEVSEIRERLAASLPPDPILYAPAAIGTVGADHELVREAALELRAAGHTLNLYADLPHANQHGWPGWLNGSRADPRIDERWDRDLAATGLDFDPRAPTTHRLSDRASSRKLEAVRAYATQIEPLEAMFGRLDETSLGLELVWELPRVRA